VVEEFVAGTRLYWLKWKEMKKRQVYSLAIVGKCMKISSRCKKLRKKNSKYFQMQEYFCSEGGGDI